MPRRRPRISIVIPTLNEEKNIKKTIAAIKGRLFCKDYEIIVSDGNSIDRTIEYAMAEGARVIRSKPGKGRALRIGFEAARGEILVSIDADMSMRPEEINLMVTAIDIGYDICMGSRFITGGGSDDISIIRKLGNKFFVFLVNSIYRANYTDLCYGYRAFRKDVLKKLDLRSNGFGIETEISIMAKKSNLNIIEIPSFEKVRISGESNLKTFRDGYIILKTILDCISR